MGHLLDNFLFLRFFFFFFFFSIGRKLRKYRRYNKIPSVTQKFVEDLVENIPSRFKKNQTRTSKYLAVARSKNRISIKI